MLRRQVRPAPLASSNSVWAATPLTPPLSHLAPTSPSRHWASVVQLLPVTEQVPGFCWHAAVGQTAPAFTALASQSPVLFLQTVAAFDVVHAAPAATDAALQVPNLQSLFEAQIVVAELVQVRSSDVHWAVLVQIAPLFFELRQILAQATIVEQALPSVAQVPLPTAAQLPEVQNAPPELQVPTVGQVVVQAAPVIEQVLPVTVQLLGEVVQMAPAVVPPQWFLAGQLASEVHAAPPSRQVRAVFGQSATVLQVRPVLLHFLISVHWAFDVHALPLELQTPA